MNSQCITTYNRDYRSRTCHAVVLAKAVIAELRMGQAAPEAVAPATGNVSISGKVAIVPLTTIGKAHST